jgi:superfamily II DNA/RNA helicase
MPYNKQNTGAHGTKGFTPRTGVKKSGPKAGSRSPSHRGYRPEPTTGTAKKPRWNAEERATRQGNHDGARSARPNWEPRGPESSHGSDRRSFGGSKTYGDRPAYGERKPYGDRNDRPKRSYDDRPARSADDRAPRGERPSYGDRHGRPSSGTGYDRAKRSNDDRPARSYADRPARSYDDRPKRSYDDRPKRSYDDRPKRSYDDRPARSYDDRAPRRPGSNAGGDRHSNFYGNQQATHAGAERHHFTPHDDVVLGRLEAEAITASEVVGVSFSDLGLGGNIVRQLAMLGAEEPFPIQAATIPDVLAGKDVLGRGKTGSGKTIAFGAPLVERLMQQWADGGKSGGKRQMGRKPRALIMAPTRELALQIDRTVQPIARSVGLFTTQIYGGVPQHRQVGALQRGVDIVIGTPGRIEDLIEQGRLDLSQVTITVLDEADYMCDLGFLEPVQRILRHTADGGQKLLFSATLDKGVAALVKEFLPHPTVHEVAGEDQASSTIDHKVLVIEHRDKGAIIQQLTDRHGKTLVFARTRAFAEQLADQLDDAGIPAVSLHGDLNQARRTRNLEKLTSGRINVLVATDVAARGIHVDDIDLVIQADAPDEYKTYLHRSGRTGRAGKPGTVVTLIPRQRRRRMDELLDRAEITADFAFAVPGDQHVTDLAKLGSQPQQ